MNLCRSSIMVKFSKPKNIDTEFLEEKYSLARWVRIHPRTLMTGRVVGIIYLLEADKIIQDQWILEVWNWYSNAVVQGSGLRVVTTFEVNKYPIERRL